MIDRIENPRGFIIEAGSTPNKTHRFVQPLIKPEVALIHHTGDDHISGTLDWFANRKSRVSADFVIGRDGRIVRVVPKGYIAWHAGKCSFHGKVVGDYNYRAYGIELVNKGDGVQPYPEEQIEAMAFVIAHIQAESPTVRLLRRHADVAYPLGRKTDPAGLSIGRIYDAVRHYQPHVELI